MKTVKTTAMQLMTCLALAATAVAQSGGTYDLTWNTMDGGGGTSTGGTYLVRGTIGQADAGDLAGGTYTIKGGFWSGGAASGTSCTEDADCDDGDACTYDECVSLVCQNTPRLYGDINNSGVVNVFDIFCQLDVIAGADPLPTGCDAVNADIEPCTPNGTVNVFDIFAVLNAIAGDDPCCEGTP